MMLPAIFAKMSYFRIFKRHILTHHSIHSLTAPIFPALFSGGSCSNTNPELSESILGCEDLADLVEPQIIST